MSAPRLACPACLVALDESGPEVLACPRCLGKFYRTDGVLDLRQEPANAPAPTPMEADALAHALVALDSGTSYKVALEQLLFDMQDEGSDGLQLLLKESRGAWTPLLSSGGGSALFLGNAVSGTVPPIAYAGFDVTLAERNTDRLRFALARSEAYVPGTTRIVACGDAPSLPFEDNAFDLVVIEDGLPSPETGWGFDLDELVRVTRGELFFTADNRFAYKRSTGRRGQFRVARPWQFMRDALRPARGERTLGGYRDAFASDLPATRAYSLYPHTGDFTHVVALDEKHPQLTIGPKEERNKWKLGAHAVGLFPWLTPSFGILASRKASRPRIEGVLAQLAERIGEPAPSVDVLVATRSGTGLIHTHIDGASEADPAGRWTLHLPLSDQKRKLVEGHHRYISIVQSRFPDVPIPEPLFAGDIDGVWFTCERRLPGLSSPNYTGDFVRTRRTFLGATRDMAKMVVEDAHPMTLERFEDTVGARFRIVTQCARVESTMRNLERMHDEIREKMVGRPTPWVLYHADLRSKHIQVDTEGNVLGYMDWGASEDAFLPYVDVLHMVAHQRSQETSGWPGDTWTLVRDKTDLREHERAAMDDYCERVQLDPDIRAACEIMYPVFVAGMAERNWDYSRPRWIHRQFGV